MAEELPSLDLHLPVSNVFWTALDEFLKLINDGYTVPTEDSPKASPARSWATVDSGFVMDFDMAMDMLKDNGVDFEEEMRQMMAEISHPRGDYVCHICGSDAHRIEICPQRNQQPRTPYQGPNRSGGYFKCPTCKREWHSTNAYANTKQKCRSCQKWALPSKMFALGK